jgi:hypothetical protein
MKWDVRFTWDHIAFPISIYYLNNSEARIFAITIFVVEISIGELKHD